MKNFLGLEVAAIVFFLFSIASAGIQAAGSPWPLKPAGRVYQASELSGSLQPADTLTENGLYDLG